jgi:hypothetical protein
MKVVSRIHESRPSHHSLIIGDKGVFHNRVQPGFEIGPIGELVTIGKSFDHCVLQQIIGIISVSSKLQGEWL